MFLKDKVCIVTGGGSGLGRAFSEQLLKEGAFVNIHSLKIESEKFINCLHSPGTCAFRSQYSTWNVKLGSRAVLICSKFMGKIV